MPSGKLDTNFTNGVGKKQQGKAEQKAGDKQVKAAWKEDISR